MAPRRRRRFDQPPLWRPTHPSAHGILFLFIKEKSQEEGMRQKRIQGLQYLFFEKKEFEDHRIYLRQWNQQQ